MSEPVQPSGTWSHGGAAGAAPQGLSERTFEMLRQTKPWVRFFAVLGFIMAGLMIVGGCVAGGIGLARGHAEGTLLLLYPAIGWLFYVYPSLWLHRYATRIDEFLERRQGEQLDAALEAQKAFWKYMGIVTVVCLCLYAAFLLVMLAAAGAGAF